MGTQETGLVAFFDILGYQNIIDNNEISSVAKIIDDILIDLPKKAIESAKALEKDFQISNLFKSFNINTLIISDSILITCPIGDNPFADTIFIFGVYCMLLLNYAFKNGLPLRGAIDYGEFYISNNCFAGKPIIECFSISNSLNFSGCVVTEKLIDIYNKKRDIKEMDILRTITFRYLCPIKNDSYRHYFTLNWDEIELTKDKDIREYIYNSFAMHNKDLNDSAIIKLNNTELWLRKAVSMREKTK